MMHDRARAIRILTEARDHLSERLAERIVEAADEIIDDAQGTSFHGEIDTIYEQLGTKLANVTALLLHLQSVDEEHRKAATRARLAADEPLRGEAGYVQADTLAVSLQSLDHHTIVAEPATLELFIVQIQIGDLDAAGRTLSELLGMDAIRARHCADNVMRRAAEAPDALQKIERLAGALENNSIETALGLLADCFELDAAESMTAMQALRARRPR